MRAVWVAKISLAPLPVIRIINLDLQVTTCDFNEIYCIHASGWGSLRSNQDMPWRSEWSTTCVHLGTALGWPHARKSWSWLAACYHPQTQCVAIGVWGISSHVAIHCMSNFFCGFISCHQCCVWKVEPFGTHDLGALTTLTIVLSVNCVRT